MVGIESVIRITGAFWKQGVDEWSTGRRIPQSGIYSERLENVERRDDTEGYAGFSPYL